MRRKQAYLVHPGLLGSCRQTRLLAIRPSIVLLGLSLLNPALVLAGFVRRVAGIRGFSGASTLLGQGFLERLLPQEMVEEEIG